MHLISTGPITHIASNQALFENSVNAQGVKALRIRLLFVVAKLDNPPYCGEALRNEISPAITNQSRNRIRSCKYISTRINNDNVSQPDLIEGSQRPRGRGSPAHRTWHYGPRQTGYWSPDRSSVDTPVYSDAEAKAVVFAETRVAIRYPAGSLSHPRSVARA